MTPACPALLSPRCFRPRAAFRARLAAALLAVLLLALLPAIAAAQSPHLARFLREVTPDTLVAGADAYGPIRAEAPVAPLMQGGQRIGWAFITSDFVGTTGYAGKPIHTLVALDDDARIIGVHLAAHSEPIVLVGIPEARIRALMAEMVGLDLAAVARGEARTGAPDIISGATVTVMVIDDSILRSGIRVARALGLGGMAPQAAREGPRLELNPEANAARDWLDLTGDGTV
ncbi:MAG: regulatory protein NosR, partial [Alphaproteobacteria bacterium HGW-Alphaproteobacteria-2]